MKKLSVDICSGRLPEHTCIEIQKQLASKLDRLQKNAFVQMPNDAQTMQAVVRLVEQKKQLHPCMLVVIGVGGSNLGTMAVQEALFGALYNDMGPFISIYYADTIDSDYLHTVLAIAQQRLKEKKEIIVNVVSKSGRTTETIVSFELFLALLKQYRPNSYADYIVVTTDENSGLWDIAMQAGWATLAIPQDLGGRYSVLSAVGLFPLALLGIDIEALREGARDMRDRCVAKTDNPAMTLAAWQYALVQHNYYMQNMFLFSHDLSALGAWWRQLSAESLGKAQMIDGTSNDHPLVPLVSLGSVDMHSIGQLFLADITPIATTFVTVAENRFSLSVPDYPAFDTLVANIQTKKVHQIFKAIDHGIRQAYIEKKLPFAHIMLAEKSAYAVGQFLQLYMHQVLYVAHLLHLNPFDQPEVELYKNKTRKILNR